MEQKNTQTKQPKLSLLSFYKRICDSLAFKKKKTHTEEKLCKIVEMYLLFTFTALRPIYRIQLYLHFKSVGSSTYSTLDFLNSTRCFIEFLFVFLKFQIVCRTSLTNQRCSVVRWCQLDRVAEARRALRWLRAVNFSAAQSGAVWSRPAIRRRGLSPPAVRCPSASASLRFLSPVLVVVFQV